MPQPKYFNSWMPEYYVVVGKVADRSYISVTDGRTVFLDRDTVRALRDHLTAVLGEEEPEPRSACSGDHVMQPVGEGGN